MLYVLRDTNSSGYMQRYINEHGLQQYANFVGYLDYDYYCRYLKSVDCFVLPSRTEGMAASLLECMIMKCPIVATKVGGIPEIVQHERNGLLVSSDPEDFASAVTRIYSDPILRRKISENNRKDAMEYNWENIIKDGFGNKNNNWENIINKYVDLYKDIKNRK